MALLGAEVVITIIMVMIIQKVGGQFSLARWLLCSTGLFRYLYPDNNELKTLAGVPKDKPRSKGSHKHEENGKVEKFHVPRNLDIKLETALVSPQDLVHLRFYSEFQWLVDFSMYALIVYILSEMYHSMFPLKNEFNLSVVWCFLVILFAFKVLLSLTKQYFTSEESIGERSTCIVAGCVFLLVAMMVLIVDERHLETGVDPAYDAFRDSASKFLEGQGLTSVGPASRLMLKLALAAWAALVGALFTFPGLRLARTHWDALSEAAAADSRGRTLLLHINFALPLVLVLGWVRPVARDYLTARVFAGMDKPLMREQAFESLRVWLVVGAVACRAAALPRYLQTYLGLARRRLRLLATQPGRITNLELQTQVASVFLYVCVVALQYVCPALVCLCLALLYKTLGGYTWTGLFYDTDAVCRAPHITLSGAGAAGAIFNETEASIKETADQFALAFDSLKMVFSEPVVRGVVGFATWWCCFAWFATSALGLLYHSYFRIA